MPPVSRALFAGLVDDAALFPPGNATMEVGLREHRGHRRAAYADLVGPFLCPVTRIGELVDTLPPDAALRLSLVVDATGEATHTALRTAATDPRLTLVGVEAPLRLLGDDAATIGANMRRLPAVTGFLEVPRQGFEAGLDLVADGGWRAAKLRTGGPTADAFPDEPELAAFLVATARRTVPFKLTAGLHHAVRSTSAEGFEQHGVLNVLLATSAAAGGADQDVVAEVLSVRDGDALAAEVSGLPHDEITMARNAFLSFGCCGVTDPIDDLTSLGLLEEHT